MVKFDAYLELLNKDDSQFDIFSGGMDDMISTHRAVK